MPIYEYRRPDGTTFELQQTFSEEALEVDPDTGVPVERVLHAPALHFKGKGFYNTDYGTRNRQRESAAEKSSGENGAKADKDASAEKASASSSSSDSSSSSSSAAEGKGEKSTAKAKDAKPLAAKG
jgi:predicted nucleic acid-binding Zn ribbon protein